MKKTKDRGITLVALTITIIVILLLAGITISTLNGENGLFKKAINAKNEQEIQTAKEILSMGLSDILIENLGNKDLNKLDNLNFEDYELKISDLGRIVTMTKNNTDYNFLVDADYNIHDLNNIVLSENQEGSSTGTTGGSENDTGSGVSSGSSNIIKAINIEYTIRSSKIILEISTEQDDINQVKGYLIYLDNKLYTVSTNEVSKFTIEGLTRNTKYQIYCIALDEDSNYKKSEILELTTLDAEYKEVELQYPVLTDKGMMNRKFVNTENEDDYYFELDLEFDESTFASDALTKEAYDGDENTFLLANKDGKYDGKKLCFDVDKSAVGKHIKTISSYLLLEIRTESLSVDYENTNAQVNMYTIRDGFYEGNFYFRDGSYLFGTLYEIYMKE